MLNPTLAKSRYGKNYEIRYSEKDGSGPGYRTKTLTTRTANLNEAKLVLAEFIKQEQAIAKALADPTIADIAAQYKSSALARGVSAGQMFGVQHIVRFFGHMTPREIAPDDFLKFRVLRNVADGTLRRDLGALRTILNFGFKNRLVSAGDTPHIELPPSGPPRDLWLNEQQENEFLALAGKHSSGKPRLTRLTRFVAIALDTGARKSAIQGLTWDRVCLSEKLIDFRDPKLKTSKKRRVPVPISDRLLPMLQKAYAERRGSFVLDDPGDIRKTFDTFRHRTPYPWVTPHVLRHTAATLMLRAGVSVWDVAGVLGDTVETVTKVYGHHSPDYLKNAVNRRV